MMEITTEGLDELLADMKAAPDRLMREAPRVGRKAATNIKNEWRDDVSRSRHFGQIARTINFDEQSAFGSYEAEVGPDRRFRAARLAGIGTFGGANGGGGTLPDPDKYVASEGPRLQEAMGDLVDRVLGG